MDFWNPRALDMEDRLNAAIWAESPAVQELIQPYRSDWEVGEVGAQQAMHAPSRLPWVPDIVGQEWRSPSAVAVIGSAYGPFIRNAHGSHEMSVHDYDCAAVSDFQDRFVRQVVGTRTYYAKVAALLGHILPDASHLALFDLCRVAFVRCGNPRDSGGDGVVNSAHELFSRYVEDSVPRNWLWRRLNESEAGTIVALGTVAEHGVLRLLAAHLTDAQFVDSFDPRLSFSTTPRVRWPATYAHRGRTLESRRLHPRTPCWLVSGVTAGGKRRSWRLAVVPHPTGARGSLGDYAHRAITDAYSTHFSTRNAGA